MTIATRTIAVDLTPLLPGGENGGAKAFALELVRLLARAHPEARFVLLTQSASHAELASLERDNVSRLMVMGAGKSRLRTRAFALAASAMRHVPLALRVRVARAGYRAFSLLKRGGGLPRGVRADLLFCPFTAPTFHARGVPTVVTVYDLQHVAYPGFFTVEDVVLRERAIAEACARASRIAAISDFARDALLAHSGLPAGRVRTVPLRLAHAASGGDGAALLARLALEPGRYLAYPANFWRHKNHELLLTAFGLAASRLERGMKLVLTGAPGPRQAAIMDAARAMGLGERVVYAGFVEDAELDELLASSAALVFPSLYEGFGLPVTEAMALGVPVACANAGALREVAQDAALLFDPRKPEEVAGAMVSVTRDRALRDRLVEKGRARAREFTDGERMAREYWSLFDEALGAGAA